MTTTQQQPSGIHHIAIMAADIKTHIAFFSEVMGCPLVALFEMHGVPGGLHAFLRMNERSYFSIVQLPGVDQIPVTLGVTHAGNGALPSAAGTMQHLAFRADDEAGLLSMRDRIRSHGVNVIGPIDHGFCKSIYFAGPDKLTLEVAAPVSRVDPDLWIDPAVGRQRPMTVRLASPNHPMIRPSRTWPIPRKCTKPSCERPTRPLRMPSHFPDHRSMPDGSRNDANQLN